MSNQSSTNGRMDAFKRKPARCALSDAAWLWISAAFNLTRRERQVVQGLFEGDTEADVAHRMGISVHTAHTYLTRVFRKLGVRNRTALLLRVFSQYLAFGSHRSGDGAERWSALLPDPLERTIPRNNNSVAARGLFRADAVQTRMGRT
ncbi:MAG: helix-turn-helix transcriptional regulator [Planctomycetes bacterium]|nr:helix-turn-helix transcriptional regulator [Planctomycetota bacterium]